jgi:hypothetical protein
MIFTTIIANLTAQFCIMRHTRHGDHDGAQPGSQVLATDRPSKTGAAN